MKEIGFTPLPAVIFRAFRGSGSSLGLHASLLWKYVAWGGRLLKSNAKRTSWQPVLRLIQLLVALIRRLERRLL